MSNKLTNIRWLRILLTGIAVVLVNFLIMMLVVLVYAFVLAFKARGAPDQEMINQFAEWLGIWLTPLTGIILTYFGAFMVARKAGAQYVLHGLLMGVVVVLLSFLETKIFGGSLDLKEGIYLAFYLVASYLGGHMTGRKK